MNNKKTKYLLFSLLGIILLGVGLVFIWFRKGLIFAGGEEGISFYNLTNHLWLNSYAWYPVGTGFQVLGLSPKIPFFSLLEFLYRHGFGNVLLQALTFLTLILIGTISVFFLIKETIAKEFKGISRNLVPLLAGVFYLLNPYSTTQIWGRGLYYQFFIFALFPAFLLFFILGLSRRDFFYGFLAIAVSLLLSPSYVFPGYALLLWLVVFLYTVFYILKFCHNKKDLFFVLFFFLFTLLGWVLSNMFWIMPTFFVSNQQFSGFQNTEYNVSSLRGLSATFQFPLLIRLMQYNYFFSVIYGNIYSTLPFRAISFLIPIISLFSISKIRRLNHYKFYLFGFLIALFLNLGSNFPSGAIFEFFFRLITPLQIFRNSFEKLGIFLVFMYTPFFVLGLISIFQILKKRFKVFLSLSIVVSLLILVHVVFVWPMWTGQFAGGVYFNPWVKVPDYYKEADDWLVSQGKNFSIIQFPINPGDGVRFTWQYPYGGLDPGEYLFTNPSIGRNIGYNKEYYNVLLKEFGVFQPNIYGPDPDLSKSDFKSSSLSGELEKLGVGYIILHRDSDTQYSKMMTVEDTVKYLSKDKNIVKVKTFGELDIYQVGDPRSRSIVYSPTINVAVKKINPTRYEVGIENVRVPFDLYFLQLFDEGWQVYVDGQKIDSHYKVFSYANAWHINKEGNLITIKFAPQDQLESGEKISVYSFIVFSLLAISLRGRKYFF